MNKKYKTVASIRKVSKGIAGHLKQGLSQRDNSEAEYCF